MRVSKFYVSTLKEAPAEADVASQKLMLRAGLIRKLVSGAMTAEHLFKVKAHLLVPQSVGNDELRHALEALANEMMVDIALGDRTTTA